MAVGPLLGSATWGDTARRSTPEYDAVDDELLALSDRLLTGETVLDPRAAEGLVRVLGAAMSLHRSHRVDSRGRCSGCRPAPWFRRSRSRKGEACPVYTALTVHLGHSATSTAGDL